MTGPGSTLTRKSRMWLPCLFGWGVLVNLLGPALESRLFGGEGGGLAKTIVAQLSNPFGDFGIVGGAFVFSTLAVAGVSFGYFWRQDHYHTIRDWLNKEERGDVAEEELAEAETREAT